MEAIIVIIPTIVLFGVGAAAFAFAKNGNASGLWTIGILLTIFSGFMFFGLENAHGWDGLTYLLALLGGAIKRLNAAPVT